ncbi:hypothetical protein [Poriferisphaera corsica]|nr:hypothetical protein [Poriferisphaera corsica]
MCKAAVKNGELESVWAMSDSEGEAYWRGGGGGYRRVVVDGIR